ncbi:MAG: tryptophan synthase subunit alpha [Deltaproteobacteria bacterium RBG_16_47_11]|nr:MAG: tryptophan synthase subunit alpha [Deltaproteobacteria bacterium RBG_16_47_11]
MNSIDRTFKILKNRNQVALIPFIVAGDPDLETTEALVLKMVGSGADIIELGVPFSDPIADGPTIQSASQRALQKGVTLKEIFCLAERLKGMSTPLTLMTYFNPVLQYGLRDFAEGCQNAGVNGVIIPDLPTEEAGPWIGEARRRGLDTIFLIAPTSSLGRIRMVSRCSRGFIYYVSVTGVTGARGKLPEDLVFAVKRIKEQSRKPVVVGFGISTPEQAKWISHFADGIIVGSAIVKIIEENLCHPNLIAKVGDFITSLTRALK